MATTGTVNTWFQTIDGLPATTAPINSTLAQSYATSLSNNMATPVDIQANLENFAAPPPPPPLISTDLFFRTSVAQFVLREFQAAWNMVPTSGSTASQFDAWVARVIADPNNENGGGMSLALAGSSTFFAKYGLGGPGHATDLATPGFINQLWANVGLPGSPGAGAMLNVNQPVWQVVQNFVTSPNVIASLEAPIANFQNLLLAGGPAPVGSILTLSGTPGGSLTLTVGLDTPNTGFSGGAGATATSAGATFSALPVTSINGFSNTLNAGDVLLANGAAAGNSTLNYTAAPPGAGGNPEIAAGVTMTGVSAAVITNTSPAASGFNGAITGLTAATVTAVSQGPVALGTVGAGLNTALTNVTVNASHPFTATMTAAALAAAPAAGATVTLGGVNPTTVTLEVIGPANTPGYAALTVNSGGATANTLILDTPTSAGPATTNTATITVAAASTEALTISGTALNIDNLHAFTGTAAVAAVGLNVTFTNPDGLGVVNATGGAGVDTFIFDPTGTGTAGFTALSQVNGGTGTTNTLGIGAEHGAILLPGIAAQITNIQTIEHVTTAVQTAALTADLSLAPASVTTFDLAGAYGAFTTTVSNIGTQTVEYSGTSVAGTDVILTHAAPGPGQSIAFEMSQNLPAGPGGTLDLNQLTVAAQVPALVAVNFDSTGNAILNRIDNVSAIANNITVSGATALQLGATPALASAAQADAYHFATGIIDAHLMTGTTGGVTALLAPTPGTAAGMNFIAGPGTNFANLVSSSVVLAANGEGGAVINFTAGTDTVQFNHANPVSGDPLNDVLHNYNTVNPFSTTNGTVNISVSGIAMENTNGGAVAAGNAVAANPFTGSTQNLSVPPNVNYIDFTNTTQNFAGDTVAGAFASAIGAANHIQTSTFGNNFLLSFYDAATSQAVLATATSVVVSPGVDGITAASVIHVIGLLHETAGDYANLSGHVHFVA